MAQISLKSHLSFIPEIQSCIQILYSLTVCVGTMHFLRVFLFLFQSKFHDLHHSLSRKSHMVHYRGPMKINKRIRTKTNKTAVYKQIQFTANVIHSILSTGRKIYIWSGVMIHIWFDRYKIHTPGCTLVKKTNSYMGK